MTRRCPFPGCSGTVLPRAWCCHACWTSRLSPQQRHAVADLLADHADGRIIYQQLDRRLQTILHAAPAWHHRPRTKQ